MPLKSNHMHIYCFKIKYKGRDLAISRLNFSRGLFSPNNATGLWFRMNTPLRNAGKCSALWFRKEGRMKHN